MPAPRVFPEVLAQWLWPRDTHYRKLRNDEEQRRFIESLVSDIEHPDYVHMVSSVPGWASWRLKEKVEVSTQQRLSVSVAV